MEKRNHVDFISSLIMGFISIFVIVESIRMYFDSGDVFYYSPGLLSFIMGVGLFICSVMLFKRSLNGTHIKEIFTAVKDGSKDFLFSDVAKRACVGLILMGLYVYILLPYLGFVIATWIFLMVFMLFLKAGSILKVLILSTSTVAIIYVMFQVIFGVPLPEPAEFIRGLMG